MVSCLVILLFLQISGIFPETLLKKDVDNEVLQIKSEDDIYDLSSIEELLVNNPQYVKLISDLKQRTPGHNWRRKRDTQKINLNYNLKNKTTTIGVVSKLTVTQTTEPTASEEITTYPSIRSSTPRKLGNVDRRVTLQPSKLSTKIGIRNKVKIGNNNSNKVTSNQINPNINSINNSSSTPTSNKDKPTLPPVKYHYYPHNQHIYLLPECAIQQVCNAVYVRLNYTQPLCACPPRNGDPCSASLNEDDNHTIKLVGNQNKQAITLAKTCVNTNKFEVCKAPKEWSILAFQNMRNGKSHYLVLCKCPAHFRLEGPLVYDKPTHAGLLELNVYGMMCIPPEPSFSPSSSSKPIKTSSNISPNYNKWKNRHPVSSYRSQNTNTTADDE